MKYLAIDYGTKRIGFAYSDARGTVAFPLETIKNNSLLWSKIANIIKTHNVSEVVVGESLDLDGHPNILEKELEHFILRLGKKFGLPVHLEKEFFSSFEAHSRMGKEMYNARKGKSPKTKDLDSKAAAIILQRYLDKINN